MQAKPHFLAILFFNFIVSINSLFAINYNDSILVITQNNYHDTVKINLLSDLMEQASQANYLQCRIISTEVIKLAKLAERPDLEAKTYSKLANYNSKKGIKDSVIYFTRKANTIYENEDNYKGLADSYRKLAAFYIQSDDADSCLYYFEKGYKAAEIGGDSLIMAKILIQKAGYLGNAGFYQRAVNTIIEALNMPTLLKDSSTCSLAYTSLALIHFNMENIHGGIYNIKKSLTYSKNTTRKNYAIGLVNLGGLYGALSDTNFFYADSTIHYSLKALEYDDVLYNHMKNAVYNNLANTYMTKDNYPEALKYINMLKNSLDEIDFKDPVSVGYYASVKSRYYSEMKEYNKAITILKKYQNEVIAAFSTEYYKFLSDYYFANNQYKEAYIMLDKYDSMEDSIKKTTDYKKLYLKEAEYNYDLKEQALIAQQDKLEAQQQRRQVIIIALIGFLVLLGAIILLVAKENKRKERDNKLLHKQNEEIEDKERIATALLAELNHRVKNNLQMVSSLLAMQTYKSTHPDVNDALEMAQLRIDSISLLHQHLYKVTDDINPEINPYLTELIRYIIDSSANADIIELSYNIANIKVKPNVAIHLGLIINELIINALKYGIDPDKDNNYIRIEVVNNNDKLYIVVTDSGNKCPKENSESSSLGFKLINLFIAEYNGIINTNFKNNGEVKIELKLPPTDAKIT